jgi:hypothetical protein
VKGWSPVFLALALGAAPAAFPAQTGSSDLNGVARELARKTAAFAGKGEGAAVTWRDVSSLGSAALGAARAAFESGLSEAGGRLSEVVPGAEAQITLSENPSQYLLVEEIRKGEDRQVWIAGWPRSAGPGAQSSAALLLQIRLLWEQKEPMLDAAIAGDVMLVLSASGVTAFDRRGDAWQQQQTARIQPPPKPWPRDLRGQLRWNGGTVQIRMPGVACEGQASNLPLLACHPGDELWPLESGRALLLAHLASGRNYFDGRVVTQSGSRRTVPPFYSAAAVDEGAGQLWLLATVEGGTQMFDAALDPVGPAGAWGSDIAASPSRCGGRSVVLATRPGDGQAPDSIQAYAVANRSPVAVGAPAEFPGPVTALWPSTAEAMAVVRHAVTGQYQLYAVTVACAQ